MRKTSRIYLAGHTGLVGSSLRRKLLASGYTNIITRTHGELDLTDQGKTISFFAKENPEIVILAAAKVGGIAANQNYPADFLTQNLLIQTHVIHSSFLHDVKSLLFLGSSCIYPRECPQPIQEEYLLTSPLEPTNESYAIAKIAGVKMCQSYNRQYGTHYFTVMPSNLYGPNDNFDLETSHVLPALLRKFHEAKKSKKKFVTIWGTGTPYREFLHVDDLADACIHLLNFDKELVPALINVGVCQAISIQELAKMIQKIVGFQGEIVFDASKPDGTPRKLLDIEKITRLGWQPKISLKEGIQSLYNFYQRYAEHSNSL